MRVCGLGICGLGILLYVVASSLRAEEGQTSATFPFVAVPMRLPQTTDQPQTKGTDQPVPPGNLPPNYSELPPPPPEGTENADLATRVSELEKQLAAFAKAAAPAAPAEPVRPLIAPTGRLQFDVANFSQNAASNAQFGNAQNTVGFRRARIGVLGEYGVIDYIVEMDFANRDAEAPVNTRNQSTAFKNVYIQVRELPLLGNVRVGHFKEPFGLEQLTSDSMTTFLERSVADEPALVPGRNDGIQAFNWSKDERLTWGIGAFTNQSGFDQPPTFVYDHWGLDYTMRGTYLAWYDEPSGGRGLLHTGLDYAYRSAPDGLGIFAARPESVFAPLIADFILTDVKDWQVFGAELATVYGPLSFQSEFFGSTVERENGVNNNFCGGYAFVSYFLTGENRPYNRKLGVFDRVRPYEDFFRVKTADDTTATGRGAWELAYRFSYLNMLDNLTTQGAGMATDHTLGLNWYLNPYTRVMFNYIHSMDTYNPAAGNRVTGGNMDIFEVRCAMDF